MNGKLQGASKMRLSVRSGNVGAATKGIAAVKDDERARIVSGVLPTSRKSFCAPALTKHRRHERQTQPVVED